ncbi:hypothetical protein NLJ89_g3493 [Agrocybe chaxingu]|uniref:Glycosyltransferase family 8 protein n=1 Tax=Agrocybe chaxingu TaxID=84603 RepID=A0A9W8K4I1_9AGAR|nr:hypothetical protein NLJ89_g3493 [Agrocybe chaxingu]
MRHRALSRPIFPYYTGARLTTHIQGERCPSNFTNIAGEIFGSNVTAESLWPFGASASATRFAYVFYATEKEYLCSAVVNFRQLCSVNVAGEIALIYPATWDQKYPVGSTSTTRRMLDRAHEEYRVNLHPVKLWRTEGEKTWSSSLTKLHIFGLADYTRLIYLDSDALVLRNLYHLFLPPWAQIALPRAYWLDEKDEKKLTSHIMVIAPSDSLMSRYVKNASSPPFDMEVVNALSASSALILPHRRYALLTGEFRCSNHTRYLAEEGPEAEWDPSIELSQAFYIHFSDWPFPKPWIRATEDQIEKFQPECDPKEKTKCWNRQHWQSVYDLYHAIQDEVCITL